jgi:phycobilisome rod-core linker protein
MTLSLINYAPKSQNQRVTGYEIGGDELPKIYNAESLYSASEMDLLIEAAYRQVFFHVFKSEREPFLESQLRNKQITVRDFIRGLLLSETFRNSFYEKNSNYRFVEHCVNKILGRDVYSEREKIAWSIVVVNKGIKGFVDELLNSEEYLSNFGYDIVPYHRRRNLPSRELGERPFKIKSPRYDAYYRQQLEDLGYFKGKAPLSYRWEWQKPPYPTWVGLTGKIITITGAGIIGIGALAVTLAAWGIITL